LRYTLSFVDFDEMYLQRNTQRKHKGQVAQLVEQRIENPRVGGSIPPLATKYKTKSRA
jgi:hypothetical protein